MWLFFFDKLAKYGIIKVKTFSPLDNLEMGRGDK